MFWFSGTIRNAVEEVKSSGHPFLVFIYGDDKLSAKYETFLNNNEAVFQSKKCVAVKIADNSLAHKQFKAIYNTVPIPSVFVIGGNGIPLGVVCFETTSEALHGSISNILEKHKPLEKIKEEGKIFKKEKMSVEVEERNLNANNVAPAKELSECSNQSGVDSDMYTISSEEIQRRLDEIRSLPRFLLLDGYAPSPSSQPNHQKPQKYLSARIQFRLPSNDMPSWEFPNEATLQDVKIYLAEKLKLSNFKLLRTYPRTGFSPEDDIKTLTELGLIPSATLIVVPVQDEAVQAKIRNLIAQPNVITTLVTSIMQPFIIIFNNVLSYIRNIFHRRPEEDDSSSSVKRMQSDTSVEKRMNKKTSTSNIHGFAFDKDSDSDEDMNTYNGNSTQQQ